MSRIRTVKPEFWCSEQIVSCSVQARLLFIGLWNFCDDAGVHPASYIRLKAEVFPIDSCSVEDIKQWVGELINHQLLREYMVDGIAYWVVTGWNKHQRIDRPTYKHPLPQSELKTISENSPSTHRTIEDQSATSRRMLAESSPPEGNGKESNGKERDIREVETSPAGLSSRDQSITPIVLTPTPEVLEIFQYWQSKLIHPKAKLDAKRCGKILAALRLGYSTDELKQAIDGCANSPFNMGQNDRKQVFDGIDLIFRDADHIDRFISQASNNASTLLQDSSQDWMRSAL